MDRYTSDLDIYISEYNLFRQDRRQHNRGDGLVDVYIKDIFKASHIEQPSSVSEHNFQQLWLKVQCKKFKSFLLCTVYRPPDSPIIFLEHLSKTPIDLLLPGLKVIILGDLNCNMIETSTDGRALAEFCSTFNLTQLVNEPTRVTETLQTSIDAALTTNVNIVYACEVKSSTIIAII